MLSEFASFWKESLTRTSSSFAYSAARTFSISMVTKPCGKEQIECRLAWQWWNSTDLRLIYACILSFRTSRHKPKLESTSKYGFPPNLSGEGRGEGGGGGGVLSMRLQVILDSLFARPGSAPIGGGKKGEFRDWSSLSHDGGYRQTDRQTCFYLGSYTKKVHWLQFQIAKNYKWQVIIWLI